MNLKHKRKGNRSLAPRCPYCGSITVLRSADGIYQDNSGHVMLYVCKNYPRCDSYVRVKPGTNIPMGTPANKELRVLRTKAHYYFDQMHTLGIMSKKEAYQWLADLFCCPLSEAHIGMMGEYYCQQVINESKRVLEAYHRKCASSQKKKEEEVRAS